ncbi:thiamine biosynthesis protein ThiF [Mameliella alba]|uniref:HesA/MoeB/ThiF family protein n=1 Tax=Mameliella alba TaxID=561184 RepID=UPI000B52D7EF|nr:HesA/MoeB/ThiF family protein [Mameliella alba]OWV60584.1 thiamine biosynthesis protein ThiF [Mameliella alba]
MNRYARQTCLPEVGEEGQARLAAARVLLVGAGGLGSAALPLLAGAGVGQLRIVDPDVVEESNLHRQTLYRMSDIGRSKVEAAAEALSALNPDCRIDPLQARLDPALARAELSGADVVIDAADSFAVTYALSDLFLAGGVPLISASVLGRSGYAGGFCGGAPSYRSVFPDLPALVQSCAVAGVMGPAVAMLGSLQAQMALSVLLGHAPSPLGQVISVGLATWRSAGFRFDTAPEPEVAGPAVLSRSDLDPADLVVELRPVEESPGLPVPHALRLGSAEAAKFDPPPAARVVFVCATGLRAWRAAQALALRHTGPVAILADGP